MGFSICLRPCGLGFGMSGSKALKQEEKKYNYR